jgi:hypothetical protein
VEEEEQILVAHDIDVDFFQNYHDMVKDNADTEDNMNVNVDDTDDDYDIDSGDGEESVLDYRTNSGDSDSD